MKKMLLICTLLVGGCAEYQLQQENQRQQELSVLNDKAELLCKNYGYKVATDDYNKCMRVVVEESLNNTKDAAAQRRTMIYSSYLSSSATQQRTGFTCHHMGAFTTCN